MLIGDCRVTSVRLRDDFSHIACKLSQQPTDFAITHCSSELVETRQET
jgi:hypothetical protein